MSTLEKAYRTHLVIKRKKDNLDITSSFVRVWTDRQGNALWYEFRGSCYNGYHKPDELIIG